MSTSISVPRDVFATSIKNSNEKAYRPSGTIQGTVRSTDKNSVSGKKPASSGKIVKK